MENVLASRYASRPMAELWSEAGKVVLERELWVAVLEAQRDLGIDLPDGVVEDHRAVIDRVDLESIRQREQVTRHDVKARIEEFCALAGHEHVHKGMTSRDLTENVEQLQVEELLAAHRRLSDLLAAYPLRGLKGPVGTQQDLLDLFDGDADRVFLVDEAAEPVSGTLTTALVARSVLRREPGAAIVHNLICGRVVPEVIAEHGGRAVRTRVGHSFIKAVMAEEGAAFGGEHSGHYYFRDNWRADSGLIAALIVLAELSASGGTLSDLLAPFRRHVASGELNSRVADPVAVIEHVSRHYASSPQDRLDGLTVECDGWWFNLRPSNTEPLLRLNLEAGDADACAERVAEVQALIDAVG